MLTGTGGHASKRSLIVRFTVSGQAPCSGAERRNKELDEVSTAILGGVAAENAEVTCRCGAAAEHRSGELTGSALKIQLDRDSSAYTFHLSGGNRSCGID